MSTGWQIMVTILHNKHKTIMPLLIQEGSGTRFFRQALAYTMAKIFICSAVNPEEKDQENNLLC